MGHGGGAAMEFFQSIPAYRSVGLAPLLHLVLLAGGAFL